MRVCPICCGPLDDGSAIVEEVDDIPYHIACEEEWIAYMQPFQRMYDELRSAGVDGDQAAKIVTDRMEEKDPS